MAIILIHSSKTMRSRTGTGTVCQSPELIKKATQLAHYVASFTPSQLEESMKISRSLAVKTHHLMSEWSSTPTEATPAIDVFLGDVYSGLRVTQLSTAERAYSNEHLYILSGLYGVLHPFDGISAYRLEMGYRFADEPFKDLYKFWGDDIAGVPPTGGFIVNLSALEYTRVVLPYLRSRTIITPKFLTCNPRTKIPKHVVVHTKIARGAFARWMIVNEVDDVSQLREFADLNYQYSASLSTVHEPVYTCEFFGGKGLSVRLKL